MSGSLPDLVLVHGGGHAADCWDLAVTGPLALLARYGARLRTSGKVPTLAARYAFCNGMTSQQRAFALSRLCADAASVAREPVDRSGLPSQVPRTWILTTRDRALSVNSQMKSIEALGGVDVAVRIDACHDVMISHPRRLAEVLVDRCLVRQAL